MVKRDFGAGIVVVAVDVVVNVVVVEVVVDVGTEPVGWKESGRYLRFARS